MVTEEGPLNDLSTQREALAVIERWAAAAGVTLQPLSVHEARALEQLQCTAALWSPTSGIVGSMR